MAIETHISEEEYQHIVLGEPDRQWELRDGRLRERPGMSWNHGRIVAKLSNLLQQQLASDLFAVGINVWRVRRPPGTVCIPDIVVVPTAFGQELADRPGVLAIFSDPLPLVVEVWSASTGDYDVDAKLPIYQQRGDLEIWRIHPYERTVTTWVRQPDGSYTETVYREGVVSPSARPGVTIDLAALFSD
jgi:Uma2 family endonuclease